MKRNAVQQQAPARKAQKHSKSETVTGRVRSAAKATRPRQRAVVLLSPGAERLQWQWSMAMVKGPAKSASRKSTSRKPAAKSVMLPTDRLAYSPIADRAPLKLPNSARMAVWVIINVEEWDATQPMPRTVITPPAGGAPMPDVPNWAWHEYGNRVGFWRFVEIFDAFAIPGVLAINGSALAAYPQIVRAAVERNWEFMGHGFTQRNLQKVADERADIRKVREVIAKATGKRPRGWLGPGLTETWQTPDVLAEEGYDYVADWVLDDQPVWLKTRGKPILNLPYTQECNDVAMMLIQHHKASEYCERALDQFEQIYADSATSARIMALSMHPYIMGAPHRVKYLRRIFEVIRKKSDVLFWTGAQIANWFAAAGPKAP
jgi:allantoinase